jgi:hypothetical protein
MLPKDGDRLVEDIFSRELFPSSHWIIIDQFISEGLAKYSTKWSNIAEKGLTPENHAL